MSEINLKVSREEARGKLLAQIEVGTEICNRRLPTAYDQKKAVADLKTWNEYNDDLLQNLFDNKKIADEYMGRGPFQAGARAVGPKPIESVLQLFRNDTDGYIRKLQSLVEQLELYPEPCINSLKSNPSKVSRDVFLVHGRDDGAKETVARFLEKLELNPIILHEQANRGMTLIEKFEEHCNVAFAVVILTPDDVGYLKDQPNEAKPRARQNVVFELGFFFGKLGRERVCALHKGSIEILSDIDGIIYVSMEKGTWHFDLAREIRAAGIDVDLNKVV